MLQAIVHISDITKSHLTNAPQILNFLRIIAPPTEKKKSLIKQRKKSASVGKFIIFIYPAEQ